MSAQVLTNVQLLLGSFDLSAFSGEYEEFAETQMKEANNFAGQGYTIMLPGLTTASASIKGHADYAASAVSTTFGLAAKGTQYALSVLPLGTASAAGDPAQFMRGVLGGMKMVTGAVGEVADFEMTLSGDSAGVDGVVALPLASRGAVTGTAVQMRAVGTTARLWAALHVTAGTFTNLVVTIESDTVGFPSATTVITFSTVSATGWQFASVAGPITDDYFRAKVAISTGTATCAVVMGII
jgi:hypothetical protein